MKIPKDTITGKKVQRYKSVKPLRETFLYATQLPPWLTVTGTTASDAATAGDTLTPGYSISPPSVSHGYLEVELKGVNGEKAELNLLPGGVLFSSAVGNCKELRVEFDSSFFSNDYTQLEFYFQVMNAAATSGIRFKFGGTSTLRIAKMQAYNTTLKNEQDLHYEMFNNSEYRRRKNLSFTIRHDGMVWFGEGDDVQGWYKFNSADLNLNALMFPKAFIKNIGSPAAPQYWRVGQVVLTYQSN